MSVDVPIFKKCCFCIPLRPGLLVWAYIRMFMSCFLLFQLLEDWFAFFNDPEMRSYMLTTTYLSFNCITTLAALADLVFNIVFIVGCHQKKIKPMNIFYRYSQIIFILSILTFIYICADSIYELSKHSSRPTFDFMNDLLNISTFLINLVVQGYLLMLMNSEIFKRSNNVETQNKEVQFQSKEDAIIAEYKLQIEALGKKNKI